jgi:basic amino acid/polyamine antiporter, APA family
MTQSPRGLTRLQLFMMCFGAIVGVGWITILGQWLSLAGPGGSVIAIVLGAVAMLVVASGYASLARANQLSAGGEIGAVTSTLGPANGFAVTAALALACISIVAFEAVSAGWILVTLFPALEGPVLYRVFGQDVHLGTASIALLGTGTVALLNLRSITGTARTQNSIVFLKIAVTAVFCIAGLLSGKATNLLPLLPEAGTGASVASPITGILTILATMPLWYAGFHVAAVLSGERSSSVPLAAVGWVMYASILGACLFYVCIVLAASYVVPWQTLLSAPLPAATAFREGLSSATMANLVLVSGLLGICSAWIACFTAAVRILNALHGQLQAARVTASSGYDVANLRVAPATLLIAVIAGLLSLAGRPALVPIVNVASLCFGVVYLFVSIVAWRHAARPIQRARASIGIGVAGFMAAYVIYSAVASAGWTAPEVVIIALWLMLGVVSWLSRPKVIAHAI